MEQFAIQRLCLSSYVYLKQCFCLKAPFFKHTLAPVFSSHIVNKHGPFSLHIYFFVFFSSPFQFNTLLGAPVCCGSGSDGMHTTFSGCRFVIRICEEYKKKLENMLKFHTLRDLIFSDINNINSLLKKEFFKVKMPSRGQLAGCEIRILSIECSDPDLQQDAGLSDVKTCYSQCSYIYKILCHETKII